MTSLEAEISWAPTAARSSGSVGLADVVQRAAARLGRAVDPHVALGFSGAAFRHYLLHPADNHAFDVVFPGVRYDAAALSIDNFGVLETLAPLFSLDIRRWGRGSRAEIAQLMRLEFGEGRSVGARVGDGAPWSLVTSFALGNFRVVDEFALASSPVAEQTSRHEMTRSEPWDGPELVSVRLAAETPVNRRHAVQRELLAYVRQHAHTSKEIGQHTDFVFASGLRAWRLLAELGGGAQDDPTLAASLAAHLAELRAGREAAPSFLRAWRDGLESSDAWWSSVPGGAGALDAAAAAYDDVAVLVATAQSSLGGATFATDVLAVAEAESRAVSLVPVTSGLF